MWCGLLGVSEWVVEYPSGWVAKALNIVLGGCDIRDFEIAWSCFHLPMGATCFDPWLNNKKEIGMVMIEDMSSLSLHYCIDDSIVPIDLKDAPQLQQIPSSKQLMLCIRPN